MSQQVVQTPSTRSEPNWLHWVVLVIFIFLAFESALLAVSMKGSWFVLLAPAVVCAMKSVETWRELKKL
jgi:hypothetical protein